MLDARLVAADADKDRDKADWSGLGDKEIADLRRQLEMAKYAAAITDAQKALLQRDDEIAVLRDKLSSAQVQVEALTDRCKALEQRIKELEKEKENGDGKKDDKRADAPRVEGQVTKTDHGLVVISIGSDAGVVKGMTLEVFRTDPPTYLGPLRIIDVRPTEAVGESAKPIQSGDRVTNQHDGGKPLGWGRRRTAEAATTHASRWCEGRLTGLDHCRKVAKDLRQCNLAADTTTAGFVRGGIRLLRQYGSHKALRADEEQILHDLEALAQELPAPAA